MKKITALSVIILAINLTVLSQYSREKEYTTHCGLNISRIYSGSGHGYGITANAYIQKGRKSLEAGAIFNTGENRITGADLRYKVILGHFNDFQVYEKLLSPYFQYNLVYQKATIDAPVYINTDKSRIEVPSDGPVIITTMEHYVSLGLQLKLVNKFYIDGSFGLGVYIGTTDKENKPASFGIHKENHGFTFSYKVGIGYRLK